ncbi:MAG: hypothetical protein ACRECI_01900, partial [Methyloceanibacter sp.]
MDDAGGFRELPLLRQFHCRAHAVRKNHIHYLHPRCVKVGASTHAIGVRVFDLLAGMKGAEHGDRFD